MLWLLLGVAVYCKCRCCCLVVVVLLGVIVVIDMMGVLFIVPHYCLVVFVWFYGGVLGSY